MATSNTSFARQVRGSTFLSLEHSLFMGAVVALPVLLAVGVSQVLELWTKKADQAVPLIYPPLSGVPIGSADSQSLLSIVAASVLVASIALVLHMRTTSEIAKRPGYTLRLAYRLPIYAAVGALAVLKIFAASVLIGIFLQSLTLIGVKNANVGDIYVMQFLPMLIAGALFGVASWYAFTRAKGKNRGLAFTSMGMVAAVGLMVAVLVTVIVQAHNTPKNTDAPYLESPRTTLPSDLYR